MEDFMTIFGCYGMLIFGLLAVVHQSTLLGFCSCVGLFTALGFSIIPIGLCTFIGFDSKNSLERSGATSLIFIIISLVIPHLNMSSEVRSFVNLFEPFRFGLHSLGATVYFLAMLIVASKYYDWSRTRNDSSRYVAHQLYFLIPLIAFYIVGNLFSNVALVNTSATFFFLYCMEKYSEVLWQTKNLAFWMLTLIGGGVLYGTSLYLKTHPELIMTMFVPSW
jgi:hypothetical protein